MINLRLKLEFILEGLSWIASTFNKPKYWIAFLVVLGASVGLEFYGRACGFNLTSDSIQYLSAAKSFHTDGTFIGDDGTYNPYWPPLFPMLLSFWNNPLSVLVWINMLCKIVIWFMILFLSITFLKHDFYRLAFLISSMISVYMIMISVFVWTELLFMALTLLNIYFLLNRQNRFYFAGLIITGFLLCILRNAGLFWTGAITGWLILNRESKVNLGKIFLFFLLTTSGLWAWNIYNTYFLPANFVFYDRPFFDGFTDNLILMAGAFTKMFVPISWTPLQLIVVLFGGGFVWYNQKPLTKNVFVFIILIYAAAFTVLGRLDAYELDRYLSVIVPFVCLVVLMAVEKLIENATKWIRYALVVLCLFWLGYQVVRTVKNVQMWYDRSCLAETSL